MENFPALQTQSELIRFVEFLKSKNVRSYLEIGSYHGGSLWAVGKSLPIGSKIVFVDWRVRDLLAECIAELRKLGQVVYPIIGKSDAVVGEVAAHAPFDCVFIDGGHRIHDVTADWENYGRMGRIVAFHDIRKRPTDDKIEVPRLWNRLKLTHTHIEITHGDFHGIGILFNDPSTSGLDIRG